MKSLFVLLGTILVVGKGVRSSDNIFEVYFAIDEKVIDNYMFTDSLTRRQARSRALEDAKYVITQTAELLSQMSDFNVNIELKSRELALLNENVFTECGIIDEYKVQVDIGIYRWKKWLQGKASFQTLNWDAAVLFTGYDLIGEGLSSAVAAYASLAAACTEHGVAVAEFKGTMVSAFHLAHELLHILGSQHDTNTECASQTKYLMYPTLNVPEITKYEMTSCSVSGVSDYLSSLTVNCLHSTNPSSVSYTTLPGQHIQDPNTICKRERLDPAPYAYLVSNSYPGGSLSNMCGGVLCIHPNNPTQAFRVHATDGMVCGLQERCSKGLCRTATTDNPVPSTYNNSYCLYGDQHYINFGGYSDCLDLVFNSEHFCYYTDVSQEMCCSSCAFDAMDLPGCEWGDRNPTCSTFDPDDICWHQTTRDVTCCYTCRDYQTKKRSTKNTEGKEIIVEVLKAPKVPQIEIVENSSGNEEKVKTLP